MPPSPPSSLGSLLGSVLPVRREERRLTGLLVLHCFCVLGAYVAARTVRDALFLAHVGPGGLPWMYVGSALGVAVVASLLGRLARGARRDAMARGTALAAAALLAAAWGAQHAGVGTWVYPALYILVEVMGSVMALQFWTLANERFTAREAKRLYGVIGAGGTAASVVVGLLTSAVAARLGPSAPLGLSLLLLGGVALAATAAGRTGQARGPAATAPRARPGAAPAGVLGRGHLRWVAVMTFLTLLTTTFVDYQFKTVANASLGGAELAVFFGRFTAAVGVLSLGMQLFGTARVLQLGGVTVALLLLPLALGTGSLALALAPVLAAATLTKGADSLLRFSVNDTCVQLLYLPVTGPARARAKDFIDGLVRPAAGALAGLALLGARALPGRGVTALAWTALGLCAAWTVVAAAVRAGYVDALQDTLRRKRLDLGEDPFAERDGAAQAVLARALASADPREVLHALELLPRLASAKLDARVEALLDHACPEVREAALEHLVRRRARRALPAVLARLSEPHPRVRAAALQAACALGGEAAAERVVAFLDDPEPEARGAALRGVLRWGRVQDRRAAMRVLEELLADPDARMRAVAARVLVLAEAAELRAYVGALLEDEDAGVRRHAVAAAAELNEPRLVGPLLRCAAARDSALPAIEVLTRYGPAVLPALEATLANAEAPPRLKRAAVRVLGRLAAPEARELLTRQLEVREPVVRASAYRALMRSARVAPLEPAHAERARAALERELTRAWCAVAAAEALALPTAPAGAKAWAAARPGAADGAQAARALLGSALEELVREAEQRAFLLLAALFPGLGMEEIGERLTEPDAQGSQRRANAAELLDNLLPRDLARLLLPLVEEMPRADRLRAADAARPAPADALAALCEDEAPWVRTCALFLAGRGALALPVDVLHARVVDVDPLVREAALEAAQVQPPETARALAEARLHDEAPAVRRRAQALLAGAA